MERLRRRLLTPPDKLFDICAKLDVLAIMSGLRLGWRLGAVSFILDISCKVRGPFLFEQVGRGNFIWILANKLSGLLKLLVKYLLELPHLVSEELIELIRELIHPSMQ